MCGKEVQKKRKQKQTKMYSVTDNFSNKKSAKIFHILSTFIKCCLNSFRYKKIENSKRWLNESNAGSETFVEI